MINDRTYILHLEEQLQTYMEENIKLLLMVSEIENRKCETCKYWITDGGFIKGWAYCKYAGTSEYSIGLSGSLHTNIDFCCKFWEKKE